MPSNPMEYIFPGAIAAQAIYAALKLGIPDLLSGDSKTIEELAKDCGADTDSLERLLRALSSLGLFERTADGKYRNTAMTDGLRADHPESHRDGGMFLTAPFLWRPLGELAESVRTGEPAFNRVFGQSFFEYLADHSEDAALFNRVMTEGASWTGTELVRAYNFARFTQLVDVGGGQGALLKSVLEAAPRLKGVLFDLPAVVNGAEKVLGDAIAGRVKIVGGSFFERVPEGADGYMLKGVIHDWSDTDAERILSNVRRAIRHDGTLLLVEALADSAERPAGLGDLLMLVIGGRDRTEADLRRILELAGFKLARVIAAGASTLLECVPA